MIVQELWFSLSRGSMRSTAPPTPSTMHRPLLLLLLFLATIPAAAQTPPRLSGTAFIDYQHRIDSPIDSLRGTGGFTFRRMFLTADFRPAEQFDARVRFNANSGTVDARGPVIYLIDLWLRWHYGGAHSVTFGIVPPPAYLTAEGYWGFRSLEKSLPDFGGIITTRDFGIRADGPVTAGSRLQYSAMFANNSNVSPETDRYKRVYGELRASLASRFSVVASVNHAGYGDHRRSQSTGHAGFGYVDGQWRLGAESYLQRVEYRTSTVTGVGASGWASAPLGSLWTAVGRYYYTRSASAVSPLVTHTAVAGLAYAPAATVRIIPNLLLTSREGDENRDLLGRLTVEVHL